jgi:hypothetical protein
MEAITVVWLVKPEPPRDADGVAAMRRAIEQEGAREGSLAHECLEGARAQGLSGEETYLFLAYQALLQLEETHQRHMYLSDIEGNSELPVARRALLAEQIGRQVGRLVRRMGDLAWLTGRVAAAHFIRTSVSAAARDLESLH